MEYDSYLRFLKYITDHEVGYVCLDRKTRRPKYLDIPVKIFYDICINVCIYDYDNFMDRLYENKYAIRANKHSRFSYHKVCGDFLKCIRLVVDKIDTEKEVTGNDKKTDMLCGYREN